MDDPTVLGDEHTVAAEVLKKSCISPTDPVPFPDSDTPNRSPWANPILAKLNPIYLTLLSCCIPGLGHLFIGQNHKATAYLILFFVSAGVGLLTLQFFVGIALLVIAAVFYCIIQVDIFMMARRLSSGFPICELECGNFISAFGLTFLSSYLNERWPDALHDYPLFVTGSTRAPQFYHRVMRNYEAEAASRRPTPQSPDELV